MAEIALLQRFITTLCSCVASLCTTRGDPGDARLETDARRKRSTDQLGRLLHDLDDVDRRALAALAATVTEDLVHEVAAAGRGDEHVLRIALERRVPRRFVKDHFAVGNDNREDIVEVVRDAARKSADRFHLLRLTQPWREPIGSQGWNDSETEAAVQRLLPAKATQAQRSTFIAAGTRR